MATDVLKYVNVNGPGHILSMTGKQAMDIIQPRRQFRQAPV